MTQDYTKDKVHDPSKGGDLVGYLLREMGIEGRHELFDTTSEGKIMPGGGVNESGKLLLEDGRVFTWWLDWDENKTAPDGTKGWYTLGENDFIEYEGKKLAYFYEILPGDESYPKPDNEAFLRANKELGLA
ncbi:MAG: hypothetical protein HYW00_00880 [Candidatus Colwellbacteria bacterium]|nr:hypothetical protein [Candidatus Colwellbacteria bacterium]